MADETHFDDRADAIGLIDLKLEELHPADPGELSGVVVTMLDDGGEYACLNACFAGGTVHHCLGYLNDRPLRSFLRAAVARVLGGGAFDGGFDLVAELGELYPQIEPPRPSGAELRCAGIGEDTELAVYFGTHCFGIRRGAPLREFFLKALAHATDGVCEAEKWPAEESMDADRKLLQMVCIKER